jgi:hypothetical protein
MLHAARSRLALREFHVRTLHPAAGLNRVAATLNFHFRKSWRELKHGRPGHRFQDRYQRARRETEQCGPAQRILMLIAALVCLAIGVVLSVIPGPAVPFFFIAGGLLAAESRTIARFMDWSEIVCRKILAWGKRLWRRLPIAGRIGLLLVGACISAGTMYLSYRIFLRG